MEKPDILRELLQVVISSAERLAVTAKEIERITDMQSAITDGVKDTKLAVKAIAEVLDANRELLDKVIDALDEKPARDTRFYSLVTERWSSWLRAAGGPQVVVPVIILLATLLYTLLGLPVPRLTLHAGTDMPPPAHAPVGARYGDVE